MSGEGIKFFWKQPILAMINTSKAGMQKVQQ